MLYIIGTPIGNVRDISLRQAETLCVSDIILAEDTRTAHKLLSSVEMIFQMKRKDNLRIISYYREKELDKLPDVLGFLREEKQVSLISESGMPLISDPGGLLLQSVIREEMPYTVIPGPSAVDTAFIHAGFMSSQFLFLGFLPKKKNDVKKVFQNIMRITDALPKTACIFYESPKRIHESLRLMQEVLPNTTRVAICREMTKMHEEVMRGGVDMVVHEVAGREVKGEVSVVVKIK